MVILTQEYNIPTTNSLLLFVDEEDAVNRKSLTCSLMLYHKICLSDDSTALPSSPCPPRASEEACMRGIRARAGPRNL